MAAMFAHQRVPFSTTAAGLGFFFCFFFGVGDFFFLDSFFFPPGIGAGSAVLANSAANSAANDDEEKEADVGASCDECGLNSRNGCRDTVVVWTYCLARACAATLALDAATKRNMATGLRLLPVWCEK